MDYAVRPFLTDKTQDNQGLGTQLYSRASRCRDLSSFPSTENKTQQWTFLFQAKCMRDKPCCWINITLRDSAKLKGWQILEPAGLALRDSDQEGLAEAERGGGGSEGWLWIPSFLVLRGPNSAETLTHSTLIAKANTWQDRGIDSRQQDRFSIQNKHCGTSATRWLPLTFVPTRLFSKSKPPKAWEAQDE